ncbi:M57 family metalloprotease [Chitinophaga sp. RAB17]|uniref:M57 family metalloprotease n=1 Tax=Chitinophaga sp. RAB17 TaxID=3233049 RepID=UPI003F8EEEDE
MGFSSTGVVPTTGGYIVEGDIFIAYADLGKTPETKILMVDSIEQYHIGAPVTGTPKVLKVYVSALGANYVTAVDDAINRFNGVRTDLTIERTNNSSDANVTVSGYYEVSNINGYVGLAAKGKPYPDVKLNTYRFFTGSNQAGWAASVILHELGHSVGLLHTGYTNNYNSNCYPKSNLGTVPVTKIPITITAPPRFSESFMRACIPEAISKSISASDAFVLSSLFSPGGVPRVQAFFGFYNALTQDHSYWVDANIHNIYPDYNYADFTHRIFPAQVSGTVALYRFYQSDISDHIYSTDVNIVSGAPGWNLEGIAGYVYPTGVAGSVPVYRYWNAMQSDHISTTDNNAANYPGYVNQGVAYYAIPR